MHVIIRKPFLMFSPLPPHHTTMRLDAIKVCKIVQIDEKRISEFLLISINVSLALLHFHFLDRWYSFC